MSPFPQRLPDRLSAARLLRTIILVVLCCLPSCSDEGGPLAPLPPPWSLSGRWYAVAIRLSSLTPEGHLALRLQMTQQPDTVEVAMLDGHGDSHPCDRTRYDGSELRFDLSGTTFQADVGENSMEGTWTRLEGAGEPATDRWVAARNLPTGGNSGRWEGVTVGLDPRDGSPGEALPITMTTVVTDDSLFALMSVYLMGSRLGTGHLTGDSLSFKAGDERFRGRISGDSISGAWDRRSAPDGAITDSGTWSVWRLDW